MNIAETAGGSSRKGQENGDASNESERPLKKARFAWQVKGKYHLKNDANETAKPSTAPTADPDVAESSGSGSNNPNRGSEQKLEILEDYLMKQDFNTLDSVIVSPDTSVLAPSTSISKEKLPYPRYVSSSEQNMSNNGLKHASENNNDMNSAPLSFSMPDYTEEQCIARWQTKQMLKGFVDNTINRVLDLWIQSPIPSEEDGTRSIALDVADFINNLPGANTIENEGILMAISAHGLQQASGSSNNNDDHDNLNSDALNDADNLRPPTPSDDESHEKENNNNQCDTDTSSNDLDLPWSYDDQKNESNDTFPLFPDASSLSYPGVNDSHQNSSGECNGVDNTVNNHCDFLDEAILFAIQSKGLTTSGSDYG